MKEQSNSEASEGRNRLILPPCDETKAPPSCFNGRRTSTIPNREGALPGLNNRATSKAVLGINEETQTYPGHGFTTLPGWYNN